MSDDSSISLPGLDSPRDSKPQNKKTVQRDSNPFHIADSYRASPDRKAQMKMDLGLSPDAESSASDDLEDILMSMEHAIGDKKKENKGPQAKLNSSKTLLKQRNSLESGNEDLPHVVKEVRGGVVRISEEGKLSETPSAIEKPKEVPKQLDPFSALQKRIQEIPKETEIALKDERERLTAQVTKEYEEKQKYYEELMQRQKSLYESQISALEAAKEHQERVHTLADTVSANSYTLASLSEEFQKDKDKSELEKNSKIEGLRREIEQREYRIQMQERMMDEERARLMQELKYIEDSESSKRENFESEKVLLRKEREQLEEFRKIILDQENERKKEILVEHHKIKIMQDSLNSTKAALKDLRLRTDTSMRFKQELSEKKYKEWLLQHEEEKKSIMRRKVQLDNLQKSIASVEDELNSKERVAEEVEQKVKDEISALQALVREYENEKEHFESEALAVHKLSLHLYSQTEMINKHKAELEVEKQEIEKSRYDTMQMMAVAKAEQAKSIEMKKEMQLRKKTYEQLRSKLVMDMHSELSTRIRDYSYKSFDISFENSFTADHKSRPSFSSINYIKELDQYEQAHSEVHDYMTSEHQYLHRSKIELDSNLAESMAASLRPIPIESPAIDPDTSRFRSDMTELTHSALAS
jgi:hypothetical protein